MPLAAPGEPEPALPLKIDLAEWVRTTGRPLGTLLAGLARDGRALELAIGTGRVAVPLAARGVRVSGIELSPAMLARLRAKPGAAGIEVVEGDMTSTRVPGDFELA